MNKHLVDKEVLNFILEVIEDVEAEVAQEEVSEYISLALDKKLEKAKGMVQSVIGGR